MFRAHKLVPKLPRLARNFSVGPNSIIHTHDDESVNCVMLHPVGWPNHGPKIEMYHAEEGIGLVKSLGWNVVKGPDHTKPDEATTDEDELEQIKQEFRGRNFDHKENRAQFKQEKITEGDYVYGPHIQGVMFRGGLIVDNDEAFDTDDEWTNPQLRESIARSSLIRVRKMSTTNYFSKGKLNELGHFLRINTDIDVVFMNTDLTAVQVKKLQKRWNDIIMGREERVREYHLKSVNKQFDFSPTESDTALSEGSFEPVEGIRTIKVVDRFGLILQIFAARAKTQMAQLQIELAWMKYARTLLNRGGSPSFGQVRNLFGGNLLRQETIDVQIKSAKGQGRTGAVGGAGETQLEIERYNLSKREAKLKDEMRDLQVKVNHFKDKKVMQHSSVPLLALVGYTNAGKTALANICTGAELESRDLLFQTLNTAQRNMRFPSGQQALVMDTVGFISNLPHGLVESFKATLAEIQRADVLVHVRDISHPHTELQKKTVLEVMSEIGLEPEKLEKRYIEVWNKIDLLDDDKLDIVADMPENCVAVSCKLDHGIEKFQDLLDQKSRSILGKDTHSLEYHCLEHNKRYNWLKRHAGIGETDFEYEGDVIRVNVLLDDIVYQRYLKKFEPEEFERQRSQEFIW